MLYSNQHIQNEVKVIPNISLTVGLFLNFFNFFFFLPFLGPLPWHMEVPRLGVQIGTTAAGIYHSHSNAGSEPRLQPTPQLTATLDP